MVGDVLCRFRRGLAFQVRGAAGRAEGMVPVPGLDAGAAVPRVRRWIIR